MSQATLTPEQLATLAAAIDEEFERSARLRRILPAEVSMPGATYGVVVPRVAKVGDHSLGIDTNNLRRPITLSAEVQFAIPHLDDLDSMTMLVRAATKRIANVEDQIIAYGGTLNPSAEQQEKPFSINGVLVNGLRTDTSCLFLPQEPRLQNLGTAVSVMDLVKQALSKLQARWGAGPYYGPYAAAVGADAWSSYLISQTNSDKSIEKLLGSDRLSQVVDEGVKFAYMLDRPPSEWNPYITVFGCETLVCDLVRVSTPKGSSRGYTDDGSLRYVIDEQFLLRVKDDAGFVGIWKNNSSGTPQYCYFKHKE